MGILQSMEEHMECMKDDPTFGGSCCCNCRWHIQDFHHCTTRLDRKPGTCVCGDPKGWICMPPELGNAYSGWDEHGMCECHEPKP